MINLKALHSSCPPEVFSLLADDTSSLLDGARLTDLLPHSPDSNRCNTVVVGQFTPSSF